MKKNWLLLAAALTFGCGLVAMIFTSCASRPPTAFERRWFDVVTNPPVVVVVTNTIPVTLYRTNQVELTVTNVQGVVEIQTNHIVIPIVSYQTNLVSITNEAESYVLTPGAGAAEIGQVGGAIGNLFGVGGIVTTALGGLFSLWGYIRSKKNYATAGNLAQTIETLRQFVRTLPNGGIYDNALVQWMQQHQAEAGVLNQVISLLEREVSNPDARIAAEHVAAAIRALQNPTPPPNNQAA